MQRGIVWVVDDDSSIRWVLERALAGAGLTCTTFENGAEVLEALASKTPDVLLSDIRMPGMDGLALLKQIKQRHPMLPVIIMTAHSDLDAAVSAYQQGAFDYLPKPFDIDEAVALVERAISHYQEQQQPRNIQLNGPTTDIIGEAPAMQDVFRIIGRLSRSSISVLINGESGTGKELVAHALHRHSPRAKAPFIALNMAAIPKDLIESELFGHEKGAFTGANTIRQGRFEQADGGTLFLDEIGDMPLDVQTRLLRVLADGQFYRVGGYAPVKVDVRIIAATHQNLEQRVQEGKFREDLFHRLNVIAFICRRCAGVGKIFPVWRAIFTGCRARTGRRSEVAASGNRSCSDASGVARQRTPAGKHLPLANGDGRRAGSVDSGFARRTV